MTDDDRADPTWGVAAYGTVNLKKRALLEFFEMEKWKNMELVKSMESRHVIKAV